MVECLEDRTDGLGASDAYKLIPCGVPWSGCPGLLYAEKTGQATPFKETVPMKVGEILEPFILEMAKAYLGDITPVERWQADPLLPWRRRSLDGVLIGECANVQIKTTSSRHKFGEEWTDQVAAYIKPQIIHEMAWPFPLANGDAFEFERTYIPVLFIPSPRKEWDQRILAAEGDTEQMLSIIDEMDFAIFQKDRDLEQEKLLTDIEVDFWTNFVEKRQLPPEEFVKQGDVEVLLR